MVASSLVVDGVVGVVGVVVVGGVVNLFVTSFLRRLWILQHSFFYSLGAPVLGLLSLTHTLSLTLSHTLSLSFSRTRGACLRFSYGKIKSSQGERGGWSRKLYFLSLFFGKLHFFEVLDLSHFFIHSHTITLMTDEQVVWTN
jgi:hypothetical protein